MTQFLAVVGGLVLGVIGIFGVVWGYLWVDEKYCQLKRVLDRLERLSREEK